MSAREGQRLQPTQRRERIVSELTMNAALRVTDLARRLNVSTETIRRDLDLLEADGALSRTYGGAVRSAPHEPSVNERHALMPDERAALARIATAALGDAKTICIGSGATTVHVARRIAYEKKGLTVVTHAFGVATVLSENPTITVIMTPGAYDPSEGAVHGAATTRFLSAYRFDWAICGASGLDADGATDAQIDAADVYATMFEQADRRMVVADHKKYGQRFVARYAVWGDVDLLACDRPPTGAIADALAAADVRSAATDAGKASASASAN